MATNILSNAVFHIIEGNIVNHKICVRYLEEIYQSVYVLVLASFGIYEVGDYQPDHHFP